MSEQESARPFTCIYLPLQKVLFRLFRNCRNGQVRYFWSRRMTMLGKTVAALLREFGHAVTPVPSGVQAVRTYETALAAGNPYDAVILDLSPIGREGGRGCLKALLELDAQVCVIGGSRYAESFNLAEYRQYGFAHVAKKTLQYRSID